MATFCVAFVCTCICSVSWLFWLSCQYSASDWLERLLWGRLFLTRKLSPQSPGRRALMTFFSSVYLFHCVVVCLSCPPSYTIYFIPYVFAESTVNDRPTSLFGIMCCLTDLIKYSNNHFHRFAHIATTSVWCSLQLSSCWNTEWLCATSWSSTWNCRSKETGLTCHYEVVLPVTHKNCTVLFFQ